MDHNIDVKEAKIDPVRHYLKLGWKEYRECTPNFDGSRYLMTYSDIAAEGVNPLLHWEMYGKAEGRYFFDVQSNKKIKVAPEEKNGCIKKVEVIPAKLFFPVVKNPLVSIVIYVYNQGEKVKKCLCSILNSNEKTPYEVIIIDDASNDKTPSILVNVSNINVIRNDRKLGIVRSYNNVIEYTKGKFLYFLDANSIVQNDWLFEMIKVFSLHDDTGVVGSVIINQDGCLEECGIQVFNDFIYKSKGEDPESLSNRYTKKCDFVSFYSFLTTKDLFNEIGGFSFFEHSMYTAADFCFSLQAKGYGAYVQPKSMILLQNKIDIDENIIDISFFKKWGDICAAHTFYDPNKDETGLKRKPVILVVDDHFPQYDKHAGGKTIFQFIKLFLAKGFNVKFCALDCGIERPYFDDLVDMGIEIISRENIQEWINNKYGYFDYMFVSRPMVALNFMFKNIRTRGVKILYYGHDLHHLRMMRESKFSDIKSYDDIQNMKDIEKAIISLSDVALYPSIIEKRYLEKEYGFENVEVITPYLYKTEEMPAHCAFENSDGILFVGSAHRPNWDGIKWFINDVLPIVKKKIPDVKLYIIGSCLSADIYDLESENVKVLGFLSQQDLIDLYAKIKVSIAPLRFGSGIKGKIIEALYCSVPVVSTSVGIEGINVVPEIMYVADEAKDFAERIIQIYTSKKAWNKRSFLFKRFINDNFSDVSAMNVFDKFISTKLRDNGGEIR